MKITMKNSTKNGHTHLVESAEHFGNVILENGKAYKWFCEDLDTHEKFVVDIHSSRFNHLFDKSRNEAMKQLRIVFNVYAKNSTPTNNKKKELADFIVLKENRPTVYAYIKKLFGDMPFDREIYEIAAQDLGLWVPNPNK